MAGRDDSIDTNGEFEFTLLEGCRYFIQAEYEGYEDASLECEVEYGSAPVGVRLQNAVQLEASGYDSPTRLKSQDSGYHTIPAGASEVTLTLASSVVISGALKGAQKGPLARTETLFVQFIPEGRTEPFHVSVGKQSRTSPWVETDPFGRFRCEAPVGNYTAWIGTREELSSKRPRRRASVTVTEEHSAFHGL